MVVRIAAAATLGLIGLLLLVIGVWYLVFAVDVALEPGLGVAGAAAVTGGIFVGPVFLWAVIMLLIPRAAKPKPAPSMTGGLWTVLFAAIAKETPWIAILGAGAVAAVEIFLKSRKRK